MKKQIAQIIAVSILCSATHSVYANEGDEQAVSTANAEIAEKTRMQHERMRMRHESMRMRHESRMADYLTNKVDTDQDGEVSYDEFMANAKSRFEASDLNDDGTITADERKEAAEIMRNKHREAMREAHESRKAAKDTSKKETKD